MTPGQHPPNAPGLADSGLSPDLKRLPYLVDRNDKGVLNTIKRLEELLADHSAVEDTLEKLKAGTDKYQRHKKALQNKIFRLRAVMVPVRWIPLEVLGIIFRFLVASDPDAIVQVSRVCTRWRQASLFPEFWSHIIVTGEGSVLNAKVNLFKERSACCDLMVTYSQSNGAAERWEAWEALMLTAERWTTVALTFDDCMSASYRIPCLGYSPVMRELSISIRGPSPIAGYEGKFGFEDYSIKKAPHLRTLTIFTHVLPRVALWFTALTKLHIVDTFTDMEQPLEHLRPIHGRSIMHVLVFCPTLVEFIFDGERSANWLRRNPPRADLRSMSLLLPNLRRLSLSCYFAIGCILLQELTAENLETLTLRLYPRFESRSHSEPSAKADAFFTRSPRLRSITLYGLNHTSLRQGLGLGIGLRQVEELHLEHVVELQRIAEYLSREQQRNDDHTWAVPRLSNLTILSNWFDVPFDEFDLAIRRRYVTNSQRGTPACILKYVVNDQNLLLGAAPGATVPFQRPVRFVY